MNIKTLLLLFFFCILGISVFAQKKNKLAAWQKQITKTWKIVQIDIPGKSTGLEREFGGSIIIALKENGQVWLQSRNDVIIDSFFTFEKNGNKYLKLSALALKINKVSDEIMELGIDIPIGEMQNAKILLVADNTDIQLTDKLIANSWKSISKKRDYYYDYNSDFNNTENDGFTINFNKNGSYTMLTDSILTKGKWKLNEDKLELSPDFGKAEKYFINTFAKRAMVLIPDGKRNTEQLYFEKSRKTPEELLADKTFKKEKKYRDDENIIYDPDYDDDYEYEMVETIEVAPRVVHKTVNELIIDTFSATNFMGYFTSKTMPATAAATIIFSENGNYRINYGTRTEKGTWKILINKNALILVRNGVETNLPYSLQKDYSGTHKIKSLTITLTLPGENELKTITFIPPDRK